MFGEGDACGNEKDNRELGRWVGCVCVCVVGSVGEGHEAEIALRIHYARLSSRESGAALVQDGQQTHD